jgi:pyruvate formate lyase activating enzyme
MTTHTLGEYRLLLKNKKWQCLNGEAFHMNKLNAFITNIQGYSIHDGPGIRTTIFFKGCNLACKWCSNPECISLHPEVGFIKALCTKCGKCAGVCTQRALSFGKDGLPRIDRKRCLGCGDCSLVCDYKALVVYGSQMNIADVYANISRDSLFYRASKGGITASGGEALLQSQFVYALFKECHKAGIHTCLETSGYAPSSALQQVLKVTDYVLFDLKHLDSNLHRQFTGRPNGLVLANSKLVVESGIEVLFRMPLIPGINDSLQNIRETSAFLKGLESSAHRIELLPYHRMGEGKYKALGKQYALHSLVPSDINLVESVRKTFEEYGIGCSVSR